MDCTFPRSSALISSPTIQCDIQQKKILSLFIQSLALVSSLSGIFFFFLLFCQALMRWIRLGSGFVVFSFRFDRAISPLAFAFIAAVYY